LGCRHPATALGHDSHDTLSFNRWWPHCLRDEIETIFAYLLLASRRPRRCGFNVPPPSGHHISCVCQYTTTITEPYF
jgi:hypothetical protein